MTKYLDVPIDQMSLYMGLQGGFELDVEHGRGEDLSPAVAASLWADGATTELKRVTNDDKTATEASAGKYGMTTVEGFEKWFLLQQLRTTQASLGEGEAADAIGAAASETEQSIVDGLGQGFTNAQLELVYSWLFGWATNPILMHTINELWRLPRDSRLSNSASL